MKKITKVGTFLFFFLLSTLLFSMSLAAYIDPSAMTYIIQIVVGIVIAGGAAFAFYFRKIKRAVTKKKDDKQEDYETIDNSIVDDKDFDITKLKDDFDEFDEKK